MLHRESVPKYVSTFCTFLVKSETSNDGSVQKLGQSTTCSMVISKAGKIMAATMLNNPYIPMSKNGIVKQSKHRDRVTCVIFVPRTCSQESEPLPQADALLLRTRRVLCLRPIPRNPAHGSRGPDDTAHDVAGRVSHGQHSTLFRLLHGAVSLHTCGKCSSLICLYSLPHPSSLT